MLQNPVLRKELLVRFRSRQVMSARVGIALAVLLVLGWIYYLAVTNMFGDRSVYVGQTWWTVAISVQFCLIALIAPSVAANAITQEKEQQTWEMLLFTRLTPCEIVFGKLIARLIPLGVILILSLPITFSAWLHMQMSGPDLSGTVSAPRFLAVYMLLFINGLFFTTFGLFVSWLMRRTLFALIASYTFVIGFLIIGTMLLTAMFGMFVNSYVFTERFPLIWINPVYQMVQACDTRAKPEFGLYVLCGASGMVFLTALMLWRMVTGFRRFAREV